MGIKRYFGRRNLIPRIIYIFMKKIKHQSSDFFKLEHVMQLGMEMKRLFLNTNHLAGCIEKI